MARLIAFGCSYTYGQGLPDCHKNGNIGPNPSNLAWPSLVAAKLGITVQNLAFPGSGNAEILDKVLRFKFERDDICMIIWSHFVRYDHFKVISNYHPRREWKWDTAVLDEEFHNAYKNYMAMHHCSLYLESIGIPSISSTIFSPDTDSFSIPNFMKIKNLIVLPDNYLVDLAEDKSHPGVKSQENIANALINGFNNVIR